MPSDQASGASDLPPEPPERPSKTQLKKAMHDLQHLGEALSALSPQRLKSLPLSESLLDALQTYQGLRAHEARRRQMQYIGKLMRHSDVEPLREAVAASQLGRARDALALHQAERWRDELIAGDDALTRWMARHPRSDLQQLRNLVRHARKDALAPAAPGVAQRQSRAFRSLFQFIRQHEDAHE